MKYQHRVAELTSLFLVFIALVFPTDPAAEFIRMFGLPGRAYEWSLILVLLITATMMLIGEERLAEPRVMLTGFAVFLWGAFLFWLSAVRDTAPLVMLASGFIPYVHWLAMLLPGSQGALPSWRRLIGTMAASTLVGAAVGAVALFLSPRLLAFLIQRRPDDLAAYYELSFRLPLGSGYLLPFLMLACYRTVTYSTSRLARILAGIGMVLFLGILLGTQSRTLLGITGAAALWIGVPDLLRSRRAIITALTAVTAGVGLAAVGLMRMDPVLRDVILKRFGTLFVDPNGFVADVYKGNRDYLYAYSGESLNINPVIGRGLGTIIPRPGGGYAAMQDVTVLNHIDKSGLLGLSLFIVLMCFTYYWMRRAIKAGPESYPNRLEYELRRLFVQYYPFILLTCLNVDMLYEDSFVLLNAVVVGSLMVEGFARPASSSPTT